jgi:hypothetical protein
LASVRPISFNVQTGTQQLSACANEESDAVVAEIPSDETGNDGIMVTGYHTGYTSVFEVLI